MVKVGRELEDHLVPTAGIAGTSSTRRIFTFFFLLYTKFIFILKGCYVAIKLSDFTGNQYILFVLQKGSISSHHPLY